MSVELRVAGDVGQRVTATQFWGGLGVNRGKMVQLTDASGTGYIQLNERDAMQMADFLVQWAEGNAERRDDE